jgi:hypothetical protein
MPKHKNKPSGDSSKDLLKPNDEKGSEWKKQRRQFSSSKLWHKTSKVPRPNTVEFGPSAGRFFSCHQRKRDQR